MDVASPTLVLVAAQRAGQASARRSAPAGGLKNGAPMAASLARPLHSRKLSSTRREAILSSDLLLAVNGTLMRGLKLNPNMAAAKATFVREAATEPTYRLWSIRDDHPAMVRVADGSGVKVAVEIWSVPASGLASILIQEPPGLTIGKVRLDDGETVLGVIGEPALVEGQKEITTFGGWRAYIAAEGIKS
jgi:gamma-glutamylcyclotransferase (GGCT)/AIG2-like uncharacterized protein YtfP